jgi:hypothetical protein
VSFYEKVRPRPADGPRADPPLHDDASIPLQDRVVALLIPLYAQPLIKIARLTVADVELDAGDVRLRLGREAVPIIPRC